MPQIPPGVGLQQMPHVPPQYATKQGSPMNQIIFIVGAVVIVLALLSFVGLR